MTQDHYDWEDGERGEARVSFQPEPPDSGWDTYVGMLEFAGWAGGSAMFYAGTAASGWDSPFDQKLCEIEFAGQRLRAPVNVLKRNREGGPAEFWLLFDCGLGMGRCSVLDEVLTE